MRDEQRVAVPQRDHLGFHRDDPPTSDTNVAHDACAGSAGISGAVECSASGPGLDQELGVVLSHDLFPPVLEQR